MYEGDEKDGLSLEERCPLPGKPGLQGLSEKVAFELPEEWGGTSHGGKLSLYISENAGISFRPQSSIFSLSLAT